MPLKPILVTAKIKVIETVAGKITEEHQWCNQYNGLKPGLDSQ